MPILPPVGNCAPPSPGATVNDWRAAIEALPLDTRVELAHLFSPSALQRARLAARDALILRLAQGRKGDAQAVARAINETLRRYAEGAWRFDQNQGRPGDSRNTKAYMFLSLNGGKYLSVRSLRAILGDISVAKKTGGNGHALEARFYGRRHQG